MLYYVPPQVPKSQGFNFLPPGTVRTYDAGKWAIYYNQAYNETYIVIDFPNHWRVMQRFGRYSVKAASYELSNVPCCQDLIE